MFVKEFLLGGTMVAAISYLGNSVNPLLAGLLGGIPIALPSLYFVQGTHNIKVVSTTLLVSTFLLFTTVVIFYYLHFVKQSGESKNKALIWSMVIWLIITLILWKGNIPNIIHWGR